MDDNNPYRITLSIPGSLDYVSSVRQLISEILMRNKFSQKFAYRSEVIVDEIITNAIKYGCKNSDSVVIFLCEIFPDRLEVQVQDEGGDLQNIERLRTVIDQKDDTFSVASADLTKQMVKSGFGLEIVKMLSEEVDLTVDANNVTTLRIVRHRKT